MTRLLLVTAAAAALAFAAGYGGGRLQVMREAAQANPDPAAGQAASPGGTEEAGAPYYVDAGQFVVPVLSDGRTAAFILAKLTLEAASQDDANRLRRTLPHTRSALFQSLYGLAGAGSFEGSAVDLPGTEAALRRSAN